MYNTTDNKVLISPSLMEGIDLKDDLARFSIILKVPYVSLADEWVKIRMNNNKNWYNTITVKNIIQMVGRGVRNETDTCITYILDSEFKKFYTRCQRYFPVWFKDAIKWL